MERETKLSVTMCDVFGLCISSLLKTFIQTEKGVSGVKRKKDGYTEKNLILTVMLCMVEDLFHNLFFFIFTKAASNSADACQAHHQIP